PVLYEDTILIHAGPGVDAGLFCLKKDTGDPVWEKDLPDAESAEAKQFKGSWATPLLIENAGRTEMLIGLPKSLCSFDPKTGDELWRCSGLSDLCYQNAIAGDGVAIFLCGYGGPGLGVRLPKPGESGDLTETHRLWADQNTGKGQKKRNRQRIGSGQLIGKHLFQLDEPGVMTCLDATTGELLFEERLGRKSWSSVNLVGGKLYANDQSGTTFVMEPDPSGLKLISKNLPDQNQHTNASLAFANGVIFQRTDAHLFAFGE
ncbi:MAG: hypothetical protein HKN23_08340, partial [Verrucomicrobiales bacterium]|nr:hypothetical protein [Verrucomicrobiales bacterium]